jgi:AhpD family alkylhydroperoxidase
MRFDVPTADSAGYKRLLAWNAHLERSALSAPIRALVETRVSQINGCAFCLAMHNDEARRAGVPQAKLDTVAAWRDDPAFTEEEAAALELAEAMTRIADGRRVPDDTWDRARKQFDDAALAALVEVVAIINTFNRINVATERSAAAYAEYAARGAVADAS